jgi:hypothetical protein
MALQSTIAKNAIGLQKTQSVCEKRNHDYNDSNPCFEFAKNAIGLRKTQFTCKKRNRDCKDSILFVF